MHRTGKVKIHDCIWIFNIKSSFQELVLCFWVINKKNTKVSAFTVLRLWIIGNYLGVFI